MVRKVNLSIEIWPIETLLQGSGFLWSFFHYYLSEFSQLKFIIKGKVQIESNQRRVSTKLSWQASITAIELKTIVIAISVPKRWEAFVLKWVKFIQNTLCQLWIWSKEMDKCPKTDCLVWKPHFRCWIHA